MAADALVVGKPLDACLARAVADDPGLRDTAAVVAAIAAAAIDISEVIGRGALGGRDLAAQGEHNSDGDVQKALDVLSHERVTQALRGAPVAEVASEEAAEVMRLDAGAPLAVAIDPLDGSSNIGVNMAVGTIFGIRPVVQGGGIASFTTPGTAQRAAGFVTYGPATALVLTLGRGTQVYVLDRGARAFRLTEPGLAVPASAKEYAINASNARHWDPAIRAYVDECQRGAEGPRAKDFNMRWLGSLVADAQRVLTRGGAFLYPGDARKGYARGRLRLLYEAAPVAMLMEQAGAAATDGRTRILDIVAQGIHERAPLVCGSTEEMERVTGHYRALG